MLDSVTLPRYHLGTMKNCESPDAGGGLAVGEGPVKQWLCRPFAVLACAGLRRSRGGRGGFGVGKAGKALTLSAHRNGPQQRAGRRSDWTRKMGEQFCETLADTCNVTLAAGAIGRSIGNVYKWRAKDATFRAGWDQALAMGYSRLEMMLLERALHGVEKVVVARDGTSSVMREYPDRVALTLLRMHRDSAAQAVDSGDGREHDEACERIIARLGRLKQRDAAADGAGVVETKGAGARLAYIRAALARCAAARVAAGGLAA